MTPNNSDIIKLAKGAGVSLIGRMIGRATSVLGNILLARLFGPETFGLYAIGWALLQVFGALSSLGLDKGVVRFSVSYWRKDEASLRKVLFLSLILAILAGAISGSILYLAAPWLAEKVFRKPGLISVIRWFAPGLALYSGLKVAAAATRVSQQMQYSVYTEEIIQPLTNLFFIIALYATSGGLLGAVAAGVGSFACAFVLALYYVGKLLAKVHSSIGQSISITIKLLTFSLPATFANLSTLLLIWTDRLMVSSFCSAPEVGVYQAASQCAFMLAIVLSAFNAIFSPQIADLYHKRQIRRLDDLFKVSTKWGLYLSLPFSLLLIVTPNAVITSIFGPRYESGAIPLAILTIAQLINVGTGAVDHLLIMTGREKRWFLISIIMLVVNIALELLLIPRFGLIGAALGMLCTFSGLFFLALFQVWRVLGIWPYDRRYLKGTLAALLTAGALWLLQDIGFGSRISDSLVLVITAVVMFTLTLLILGLDSEDRKLTSLLLVRGQ